MDATPKILNAPDALISWFEEHRRALPWRTPAGTPRDPWATLISEIMSQQTHLDVVVPRFREWMDRWPSPASLALASEDEVLSAWAGLGYYSRARNLRRTAMILAKDGWPSTAAKLAHLPGVGPYTAAAVASLAFGEQVAMVDGNVLRVLARIHARKDDLRSGKGAKILASFAQDWILQGDAGTVNEATMELGALVCTPRSPHCGQCPLSADCRGIQAGEPEQFPSPRARKASVDIASIVAVVLCDGAVLLRRAESDELLKGHWTLPVLESLPRRLVAEATMTGSVRHAITHHRIAWDVWRCDPKGEEAAPIEMEWCPLGELSARLVSSLPRKALAVAGIDLGTTK